MPKHDDSEAAVGTAICAFLRTIENRLSQLYTRLQGASLDHGGCGNLTGKHLI